MESILGMPVELLYTDTEIVAIQLRLLLKTVLNATDLVLLEEINNYLSCI
jgi:hypothetical protein